jgi:tetratricopeptide (TPR) repeat protein
MSVIDTRLATVPSTPSSALTLPVQGGSNSAPLPPATLASIRDLDNKVFLSMQGFQRQSTLTEKAKCLSELKDKVKILKTLCHTLQNECENAVQDLSHLFFFYRIQYILVKNGCSFLTGGQYGEYGQTHNAVSTTLQKLSFRIKELISKELDNLSKMSVIKCVDSLHVIGMYEMLHEIEVEEAPQRATLLEELSKKLFQEKAFEAADRILSKITVTANILARPDLKELRIRILIGQEKYDEAIEMTIAAKQVVSDLPREEREIPKHKNFERKLDELHAESLAYKEDFVEAIKIYQHLISTNPPNKKALKWAIIVCTIRLELKNLNDDTDLTATKGKFFLLKPKQMFSQLEEFAEIAWGEDNLIVDFEFWMQVLFTQKKANDKDPVRVFIYGKLKELIDAQVITRDTLFTHVERYIQTLKKAHLAFEENFDDLIHGGAQVSSHSSFVELQKDVARARKRQLDFLQGGDNTIYGSAGILRNRVIAQELLQFLLRHQSFTESHLQIRLITFQSNTESQENASSRYKAVMQKIEHVLTLTQSPDQLLLSAPVQSSTPLMLELPSQGGGSEIAVLA